MKVLSVNDTELVSGGGLLFDGAKWVFQQVGGAVVVAAAAAAWDEWAPNFTGGSSSGGSSGGGFSSQAGAGGGYVQTGEYGVPTGGTYGGF
jgi:hypothetical protein